jgi:hypothetical protein
MFKYVKSHYGLCSDWNSKLTRSVILHKRFLCICCLFHVQILPDSRKLHSGRSSSNRYSRKSLLILCRKYVMNYICTYKGVQLKSGVEDTGTWSAAAWTRCRLCCRPAVFFRYLHLITDPNYFFYCSCSRGFFKFYYSLMIIYRWYEDQCG